MANKSREPLSRTPGAPVFGAPEEQNARALIAMALSEDLGDEGDLTARLTIPAEAQGAALFVARVPGVLSGLPVLKLLAREFELEFLPEGEMRDGRKFVAGERLAQVRGPMRRILAFERTALNFLQHLSGIATQTAAFVDAVRETGAQILDTRKTTPGWRRLEKYAVRCGGGRNHRMGLYDSILIKDNHLAWLSEGGDPIGRAIQNARAEAAPATVVEIEVDNLEQLDRALENQAEIILLDNFALADLAESVRRRDRAGRGSLLEASGGVTLQTVRAIAGTGVDRISVGALTHSSPALDIALEEVASGQ